MLTAIENLKETMKKDGHPDRFVKQYEFMHIVLPDTYYMGDYPLPPNPGEGYDQYGVFWKLPAGQMGAFPVHDEEHKVIKDITEWDKILTHIPVAPPVPEYWGMVNGFAAQAIPGEQYVTAFHSQGVFERFHALLLDRRHRFLLGSDVVLLGSDVVEDQVAVVIGV